MILKSKNYNQFKLVHGNREIVANHLARLTVSILQKNLLAQNPIIVNEKMEVIDGQHRLEVARNNNLEVFYIILEGGRIEEVRLFNSNVKVWTGMDFLNSYATRGKPDYIWLKKFLEEYGIPFTIALIFLYGHDSGHIHKIIKSGKLDLSEEQKKRAVERADLFWSVRPFLKRSHAAPKRFIEELVKLNDEGLGKKLVKSLQEKGSLFSPESVRRDASMQLRQFVASA